MAGFGAAMGQPPQEEQAMPPQGMAPPAPTPPMPGGGARAGGIAAAMGEKTQPQQPQQQQATPEQQAEYNKFVSMGTLLLYDDAYMPKARAVLADGDNTVEDMARIGVAIATRLYLGAKKQGQEIDSAVILHGGWELMHEIREFAVAAGAGEITLEQTETAFLIAADMFRSTLEGRGLIDKEAMAKDFEEIRAQQGDDTLRQIAERVNAARQVKPPQPQMPQDMPAMTEEEQQR